MNKKSLTILCAAASALLLTSVAQVRADLVYGFEQSENAFTPNSTTVMTPDGFKANGNAASLAFGTTGATQGTQALAVTTRDSAAAQVQGDAFTFVVPTSLVNASSFTADVRLSAAVNYYTILPRFEISSPGGGDHGLNSNNGIYVGTDASDAVGVSKTKTISLKAFTDPDAGAIADGGDGNDPGALFTPSQIIAFDSAFEGSPFSAFLFELETLNGQAAPAGSSTALTAYYDNFQVTTPEPASLSALAVGGLLMARRRTR